MQATMTGFLFVVLLGSIRVHVNANTKDGQLDSTDGTSPIPQVACGIGGPCDGRTQFCAREAFSTGVCRDCADDVCAFGKEEGDYDATMKQCQHYCPMFAEKLAAEKYCDTCAERCSIPSTTTTSSSSETTSSCDCAEEIARKDHKINSLQSKLASKDTTLIWLASYGCIATIVIFVIVFKHRLKATFCSAKNPPMANPAKCEEGLLNNNEPEAQENDVVDDGSSNGENGNQLSEDEIPGAGGVDRDTPVVDETVPKEIREDPVPFQTAKLDQAT